MIFSIILTLSIIAYLVHNLCVSKIAKSTIELGELNKITTTAITALQSDNKLLFKMQVRKLQEMNCKYHADKKELFLILFSLIR